MSCGSAGNCAAGGFYTDSSDRYQAFIASEVNGVWRPAVQVRGVGALNTGGRATITSVSCASAGNCSAGGYYTLPSPSPVPANGNFQAFVVNEIHGTWGAAQLIPGLTALDTEHGPDLVQSVSCASAGNCSAGGDYTPTTVSDSGGNAFVVSETDGHWGTAQELPGVATLGLGDYTNIISVSCTAPGDCAAGGDYAGFEFRAQPFVATQTDGIWGSAEALAGMSGISPNDGADQMLALSCASAGECSAVGDGDRPFVVSETNGIWGSAEQVPGLAALDPASESSLTSVSCGSLGNCAAGGSYPDAASHLPLAFVVNEVDGTWGTVHPIPRLPGLNKDASGVITVLSCVSAGTCSAVGTYSTPTANGGAVYAVDESNGTWGAVHTIAVGALGSDVDFTSISCVSGGACSAAGFDVDSGAGVVVERSVLRFTSTAISLSAARVSYGDERAERVTVAVSGSGWTPAGPVTVKSGSTVACTAAVTAGVASCVVPATRFAPGRISLAASYGGGAWFAPSVSAPTSLTVVKAATTTRLSLSTSRVTYGHEQSERLTVTVAPRYAGTPSGTVAIKSGRTLVCAIRLSSGRGACTLTARQLKAATYHLIASWPGNPDFNASASAPKTLTIAK